MDPNGCVSVRASSLALLIKRFLSERTCVRAGQGAVQMPGGVVNLQYQFTVTGDLISELVIAP
jgi:hypothetical protein